MTKLQGRGRSVRKFWKRHGYRATTVVVLAVFLAQAVLGNGVAYAAAAGIEVTADAVADATTATDGQQDTAEMQSGGGCSELADSATGSDGLSANESASTGETDGGKATGEELGTDADETAPATGDADSTLEGTTATDPSDPADSTNGDATNDGAAANGDAKNGGAATGNDATDDGAAADDDVTVSGDGSANDVPVDGDGADIADEPRAVEAERTEPRAWEGDLGALALSSTGLALNDEQPARVDTTNGNEAAPEGAHASDADAATAVAASDTTTDDASTVVNDAAAIINATLNLSFALDPAASDRIVADDAGAAVEGTTERVSVIAGDTVRVPLPEGIALRDEAATIDVLQRDDEGNATTIRIAEATFDNGDLVITFVTPTDAVTGTTYLVGAVPAAANEAVSADAAVLAKLDASIDLAVSFPLSLAQDAAHELTWTLQTGAEDTAQAGKAQEAALTIPAAAELRALLGLEEPADGDDAAATDDDATDPTADTDEGTTDDGTDATDDEAAADGEDGTTAEGGAETEDGATEDEETERLGLLGNLISLGASILGIRTVDYEEITPSGNTTARLDTYWYDNVNQDQVRTVSDAFTKGLSLRFWVDSNDDGVKDAGEEFDFTPSNAQTQLGIEAAQYNAIVNAITTSPSSSSSYESTAVNLPTSITIQGYSHNEDTDQDEPVGNPVMHKVAWTLSYENVDPTNYLQTVNADGSLSMQLLREVTYHVVANDGVNDFTDTFSGLLDTDSANAGNFQLTSVINNTDQPDGGTFTGRFADAYATYKGSHAKDPVNSNRGTVSLRMPAYTIPETPGGTSVPIEYKVTYTGAQEGTDYYQASYANGSSPNHGSDVDAAWTGGTLTLTHAGTTTFDGTKVWADDGSGRPATVTYTLWRYSTQALAGGSSDPYATASQVQLNGRFVTFNVASGAGKTIDLGEALLNDQTFGDAAQALPKYDPEGYPYVYALREDPVSGHEQIFGTLHNDGSVTDDQCPQYADPNGKLVSIPGSSTWERGTDDVFLYNGGTLTNHTSKTVTVEKTKSWNIAAFQDGLEGVSVEFELYQRLEGSDGDWTPALNADGSHITRTIENIIYETQTQTISGTFAAVNADGERLEYRWVETDVSQVINGQELPTNFTLTSDGENAEPGDTAATYTLYLLDDQGEQQALSFTSTFDADGNIINSFVNLTDEHAVKLWETATCNEETDEYEGTGNYVTYFPNDRDDAQDGTATVSLYRDNVYIGSYTMDGVGDAQAQPVLPESELTGDNADFAGATWQEVNVGTGAVDDSLENDPVGRSDGYQIDFSNLPEYSESGHKYTYMVLEEQKAGWHATREYDPDTNTTTIRNSVPEGAGSLIYVNKEWVDDGDSAHRGTSVVMLVPTRDIYADGASEPSTPGEQPIYRAGEAVINISSNGDDGVLGQNNPDTEGSQGEIYLSEDRAYFAEITVPVSNLTADDFTLDEVAIIDESSGAAVRYRSYTYEEATEDASAVKDEIWVQVGWGAGGHPRIQTGEHVYEITVEHGTLHMGEGGTEARPVVTVSNRRLGIVNLTAVKNWVDNGVRANVRPDAELVLSSDATVLDGEGEHHVFSVYHAGETTGTVVGEPVENQVLVQLPGGNKIPLFKASETSGVYDPFLVGVGDGSDDEPYIDDATDTLVVPVGEDDDAYTYTFYSLPKYDGAGAACHYTIEERWTDGQDADDIGAYQIRSSVGPYNVSAWHFSDAQTYTFTNQPVQMTDIVFYKHWQDQYVNEELGQRPDIYLTLYQRSAATNDQLQPVQGYVNFLWEGTSVEGEDENYWQKVTISNLPRYDEEGDEITYYAVETMSIANPDALDYAAVAFEGGERLNAYMEDQELQKRVGDGAGQVPLVTTVADGDGDQVTALHEGGTFVNALDDTLEANGVKIWENLPGDFSLSDLPQVTVYLQRRTVKYNDDGSTTTDDWQTPTVVSSADAAGDGSSVIWNSEDGPASEYGVEKRVAGTSLEIVAWTTLDAGGFTGTRWQYTIDRLGDNTGVDHDAEIGEDQALPRYDSEGNRYQYRAIEAMWGLFNTDGGFDDDHLNDQGNDQTIQEAVNDIFDIAHGETGSFIITNTYDGAEGQLAVKKLFGERKEDDAYPATLTYNLYRWSSRETAANATLVATEQLQASDFSGANGSATLIFNGLEIYAPDGNYWNYYVEEADLDGYTTRVTLGNVTSYPGDDSTTGAPANGWAGEGIPVDGEGSPIAVGTTGATTTASLTGGTELHAIPVETATEGDIKATFYNGYVPEGLELMGSKTWNDFNNAFGMRPDELRLTLTAVSETGQSWNIGELPTLAEWQQDWVMQHPAASLPEMQQAQQHAIYIEWTQSGPTDAAWTYTIHNLERWAPDATRWTYTVTEVAPTGGWASIGYIANTASATLTAPATDAGDREFDPLVNSLLGTASVTKEWAEDDNNAYGLRPDGIQVTLQARLLNSDGSPAAGTGLFGWRNAAGLLDAALGNGQSAKDILGDLTDVSLANGTNGAGGSKTWSRLPLVVRYNNVTYNVEYRVVENAVGMGNEAQSITLVTGTDGAFAEEGNIYPGNTRYYSYEPSQTTTSNNEDAPTSYATTITNTLDPTSVKVTKVWDDDGNSWFTRPGTSTDGTTEDRSWTLTFALQRTTKAKPVETDWEWVTEYGETSTATGLTNVLDPNTGEVVEHVVTLELTGGDEADNTFEETWENLPLHATGTDTYTYRVVELMPGGYEIGNEASDVADQSPSGTKMPDVWIVAGSGFGDAAQSYTNTLPTVDLTGTKAWNTYGVPGLVPDDITEAPDMILWRQVGDDESTAERVYQYENGDSVVPQPTWSIVDKDGVTGPDQDPDTGNYLWTYTYEGLPQYDENGNAYTYWAEEVDDPNDAFTPSYGIADAAGTVITGSDGKALEDQQGTTITNTVTRFTLDKVSDDTDLTQDGDQVAQVNDVTLALTKGNKIFAVWQRSAQGGETSYVWDEGTGSDANMTEDYIRDLIADLANNGGIAMTDANAGYLVGLPTGTYTIHEVGYPEAGYAPMLEPIDISIASNGTVTIARGETGDAEIDRVSDADPTVKINIEDPVLRGHLQLTKYLSADGTASGSLYNDAVFDLYRETSDGNVKIAEKLTPTNGAIRTVGNGADIIKAGLPTDDALNSNRYNKLSDGLPEGTYYFVETSTGADAVTPSGDDAKSSTCTITQDDHYVVQGDLVTGAMGNEVFNATVTVPKFDTADGAGIENAEFQLTHEYTDARGGLHTETLPSATDTFKTDAQGLLTLENLEKGDYTLIETANEGYEVPAGGRIIATFTIENADDGETFDMTVEGDRDEIGWKAENGAFEIGDVADDPTGIPNTRLTGSVAVAKTGMDGDDADTNPDPLSGATFTLQLRNGSDWTSTEPTEIGDGLVTGKVYRYDEATKTVAEDTSATPVDGRITVSNLPWGTYRFKEITSVDGYIKPSDAKVSKDLTIGRYSLNPGDAASGNYVDTITNDPTRLELKKVAEDGATLLAGAQFAVTPVDGDEFADGKTTSRTLTTGANGTASLEGQLVVGNRYTIEESAAPGSQYDRIDGSFTVTVEGDGSLTVDGNLPEGYVQGAGANSFSFTATDPYFSITIEKLGETDDGTTPLSGATFTLAGAFAAADGTTASKTFTLDGFEADGTLTVHDLTDEAGAIYHLMKNTVYTLTETVPHDGYTVVDPFRFQLDEYGKVVPEADSANLPGWAVSGDGQGTDDASTPTITATDAPTSLVLQKTDENGDPLAGATFTVKPADPDNGDRFVSGVDSHKLTTELSADRSVASATLTGELIAGCSYTIQETGAPEGYEKVTTPFTVRVENSGALTVTSGALPGGYSRVDGDQGFKLSLADTQIELGLVKVDAADGATVLPGAVFEIQGDFANDNTGSTTQRFTTDAQGKIALVGNLIVGNEYTITEVEAPDGYELLTEPYTFRVTDGGEFEELAPAAGFAIEDGNLRLTVEDTPIELTFSKRDLGSDAQLADASFTIEGNFVNKQTHAIARLVIPFTTTDAAINLSALTYEGASYGLVAGETYALTETAAPAGYEQIAGSFSFTVGTNGVIVPAAGSEQAAEGAAGYRIGADGITLAAHDRPVEITLAKNGFDGKTALDGATFEVYAGYTATGTPIRTITTENGSAASLDGLTANATYTLHETTAPAGYELMPDVTFTVGTDGSVTFEDPAAAEAAGYAAAEEGGVVTITATDPAIEAQLVKTDGSGNPLAGAVFELAPATADDAFADGTTDARKLSATDENGVAVIPAGLLVAGDSYTLSEITAPDGFELAGSATFAVDEDGIITIDGQASTAPIAGAGGSGTYAASAAADGTVTITATDAPVQITLAKQSAAGGPLTGASFTLTEVLPDGSTGTPATIEPVSSADGTSFTFTGLVAGSTYELRETAAPAGYERIAGTLTFVVDADGTIAAATGAGIENDPAFAIDEAGKVSIAATDAPIEVSLEKWGTDDVARPDATFELTGVFAASALDGTAEAAEATRTIAAADGKATLDRLIAGNTYVLREVATQAGYRVIAGTLTFTVDADGTIVAAAGAGIANDPAFSIGGDGLTVRAENEPTKITLAKVDEAGATLDGAAFELTGDYANPDGTIEAGHTWKLEPGENPATADGLIVTNGADRHEYTLTEATAPAGYERLGSFTFILTPQGTIEGTAAGYTVAGSGIDITATDTPIQAQLMKTDEAGNPLAGATFELTPAEGSSFADGSTDPVALTTGEGGIAPIERALLVAGETYTVTEVAAPNGYELAGAATFRVNADGSITLLGDDGAAAAVVPGRAGSGTYEATQDGAGLVTITAADVPVAVQLIKVAGTSPLTGAVFSLAPADGSAFADGSTEPRELPVNADGLTALPGLTAGATYVLTEITAPAGYELNTTAFTFTVGADGAVTPVAGAAQDGYTVSGTGVITITVNDAPIELELAKTDLAGTPLAGATFALTGRFAVGDGTVTGTETRTVTMDDASGIAALTSLVAGETYTLTETVAPVGHELAGSFAFTVGADGTVTPVDPVAADGTAGYTVSDDALRITAADAPIAARLAKTDAAGTPLAGAGFTIKPVDGSGFAGSPELNGDGALELGPTDASGIVDLPTGVLIAGDTYELTELQAPDGFELAGTVRFTVDADGGIALAGAPDGSGSYTATVTEDGIALVTVTDEPVELTVYKTAAPAAGEADGSRTYLAGASFTLTEILGRGTEAVEDAEGNPTSPQVLAGTTAADGSVTFIGLKAGASYVLAETAAPAGYELLDDTATLVVAEDGTVQIADGNASGAFTLGADGVSVEVMNHRLGVSLIKTDLDGTGLAGGVFTLEPVEGTFPDGTTEKTFTSDAFGAVFTDLALTGSAEGTAYVLSEVSAPAGYKAIEPITFLVYEDGTVGLSAVADPALAECVTVANDGADGIAVITLTDEPIELALEKYATTGETLAGARFLLTGRFADGATERVVAVGEDGTAALTGLVGGESYTIEELEAPEGYQLIEGAWSFTVTPEGTIEAEDSSTRGFFGDRSAGYAVTDDGCTIGAFDERVPEEPPVMPPSGGGTETPPATVPPTAPTKQETMPNTGDAAVPAALGLGIIALLFIASGLRLGRRRGRRTGA